MEGIWSKYTVIHGHYALNSNTYNIGTQVQGWGVWGDVTCNKFPGAGGVVLTFFGPYIAMRHIADPQPWQGDITIFMIDIRHGDPSTPPPDIGRRGGGSLKSTWWHSRSLGLISPCNILRIHTPAGMPFFVLFPDVRIFYCSSWKMKFTFLFKTKKKTN